MQLGYSLSFPCRKGVVLLECKNFDHEKQEREDLLGWRRGGEEFGICPVVRLVL
jgi:hypothetical protein